MSDNVKQAHKNIRDVISSESLALSKSEYNALLEELLADAEGWKMTLDEEGEEDE